MPIYHLFGEFTDFLPNEFKEYRSHMQLCQLSLFVYDILSHELTYIFLVYGIKL